LYHPGNHVGTIARSTCTIWKVGWLLQGRRSTSTIRWSTTIIIEMTRMKTYSKISMMTTKQIINNYNDINQHNHDEADDGDTNKDVARMSKMTTTTKMAKISQ